MEKEGRILPEFEKHCQHSLKYLGVKGEDIHKWMDKHSEHLCGKQHRISRHTPEDLISVEKLFGKEYGIQLARNIFYDHLILDGEI